MLMSHGKTFMTALTLLGIVTSLYRPAVIQAGGGGARCVPPVTDCVILVVIDIKPGEDSSSINPRSHGIISVAVLTTEIFDATTIDPDTILFGPPFPEEPITAPVDWALEDVDGDGNLDLLLKFRTQDLHIQCGDTFAMLTGETFPVPRSEGGVLIYEIVGHASFQTVGCHEKQTP